MTHVFVLMLIIGGNQQGGQKMYFSSIQTCNWYASKLTKRYGTTVPEEHKVLAYCKPQYLDTSKVTVYGIE